MAKFKGTSQQDTIIGTADGDEIITLADKDYLEGGDGDDTLKSGSDSDTVYGGDGNDYIDANSADDYVDGGAGNDTIDAGSHNDTVYGGEGDDVIDGGSGDDWIDPGAGANTVDAGSGDDKVLYDMTLNEGLTNYYNGGSGYDKLHLILTADQADQYADELLALEAHIASGSKKEFVTSWGLTVKWFEELCIEIQGPINTAPDAVDDTNSLTEDDTNVAGAVLGNDSDPEGDPISVSNPGMKVGAHGTLTLNGDGTYNYVIDPADHQDLDDGETRVDNFNVDVTDGSLSDSSNLAITIHGVNDAPNSHQPNGAAAGDDTNSMTEDDPSVGGNVLTNDTDPEGDPLSVANAGVYVGTNGTLTLNANGTYTYDIVTADFQYLDDGESVSETFNVVVSDGDLTDNTDLTITIHGINDAPNSHQPNGTAAGDDTNTITEDDPSANGNVLTNDTDPEGDPLTVDNDGVYVGAHGTLTLNANGTYSYAHDVAGSQSLDDGESFFDVFNVVVSDGDATDNTELTIEITGINDAPNSHQPNGAAAGDDENTITEDDPSANGNVLTNDTDPEGDPLSVANPGVYVGAHGTLTLNGDGTYSYAHNTAGSQALDVGDSFFDVFNVVVSDGDLTDNTELTIEITGLNDGPVANDDANSLSEDDAGVNGDVLGNDTDADGDPLSVNNPGVYVGAYGTLTLNANGTYAYAHDVAGSQFLDDGESVVDNFNVVVSDGSGTDSSNLAITINGVNDAPNSHQPDGTAAGDDEHTITEDDTNAVGNVLANDTDPEGDPLTVDNPGVYVGTHGTLTLNGDGSYNYAHNTAGSQILSVGDSFFDVFNVVVSDGDATDNTVLTIEITGLNEAPVAVDDNDTLTEDDSSTSGNVLSNDTDTDNDPLTVDNPGVYVGTHGTLTLNGDGSYDYAINPAAFQSMDDGDSFFDVFNYDVSDGTDTDGGTLTIEITGVNDAPVAVNDVAAAVVQQGVNTALFGNVLDNDSDAEQDKYTLDVLSYTKTSATNFGTLNANPDGSYVFFISVLPAPGVTVIETYDYVIEDNGGLQDIGELSFHITGS